MKKIYYLLVCLFFLQSAFAAGEKQSFDVCLQNGLNMNVEVCTDGIFRIRVTPRSTFSESLMQRYGIIKTDWDPVPVSPKDNKQQFEVSTGAYRLKVDKKTGAISVSDRKGRVIIEKVVFLTSADPLCIELGEVINAKYKDMKVPNNRTIIGDDKNPGNMKDQAETGDYKNTSILSISLKDGERFYGGGSTSRDHIQHRGELLRMWTTYQHTEIPMPFMISSENWGIFNNTTRKNFFDIGNYQSDVFSIYNTTDEVDFYLMFGNSMPDVINYYTAITGRPYLLPKYAYGLCFGPNMLEDQFDILNDAVRFREMGVPCDLFWLEPQWMEKRYDFSTKKKWNYQKFSAEAYWDSTRYPKKENHRLLIGRLHGMGYHMGLWLCIEYDLSVPEEDALAKAMGKPLSGYSQANFSLTVGVVLTEKTNAGGITVYELVSLGRHPYTGFFGQLKKRDQAAGIAHKANNYVSELSDGERQKAMIAKALAQQCPIILLDEPTAFLDVTSRIETMVLLHRLAVEQEKAVLLSTHDLDLAIQMGDCLWLQEKGRPMACGTPEDLIMSGAFESFFGKEGIVFDPATGKLNTEAPTSPIGVEGDFLTSYWVGNALIRNGYRPSPVKEGQLNITCKSPHELVVAFPEGCKEELRTVAELVSLIGMRKSFYGHGNNVSRL